MQTARLADLLTAWLGGGPAYSAVASGIRGLALDGRLPAGTRIPSERQLARALGVSRTTVSAAYDVLRDQGYLRSAHGAGSTVVLPRAPSARPDADPGEPAAVRDATVAALPAPPQLLDAVAAATGDLPPLLAGHGLQPFGLPVLRAAISDHLSARGVPTVPEQVMVTGGALAGWNLVLSALTRPGQPVVVEQPTYPAVIDSLGVHSLRPVPLPVGPDGWEAPGGRAELALLTPDGQNPTGLMADAGERRAILDSLEASVVVVDETFADLVLDGSSPPPMAALDRRVVTLGSMSKFFWAGLRIGWVRAEPALLDRLAQVRGTVDLTSPVLEQLIAARLLPQAAAVAAERLPAVRAARDSLVSLLRAAVPDWRIRVPAAGLMLWIELPSPGATRLAAHALDLGLRIVPGPRFTLDGTADRFFRLPVTVGGEDGASLVATLRAAWERTEAGADSGRIPARWTA